MRNVIWLLILISIPSITTAETISRNDGGSVAFIGIYGYGQSVLTPSGGPWTNITFGFLSIPGGGYSIQWPDNAVGKLFVLTQEYTGPFGGLSEAMPGFLATGTTPPTAITGLRYFAYWEFDSSLILAPNTRYYFYASQGLLGVGQPFPPSLHDAGTNQAYITSGGGTIQQCGGFQNVVPGNCTFGPLDPSLPMISFNYVLSGVVPEPETYAMLLAGLGLLGFAARRRKQKAG